MALQRTQVFLLFLLLTLLGLGLVQPSYGQDRMYQRFPRQHVDPDETGGNDGYCNLMVQRQKMTSHQCKRFNTFIHEDLWNIRSICSTTNIQCTNGWMNYHEVVVVLLTEMASTRKVPGSLWALLFTLSGLLVHGQNLSWREFMKQHHLSTNWAFSKYQCNDLMRERGIPKDKNYHVFIYTLWHKIERICLRNWRDRYRNVYIWAPDPFKTLKCIRKNSKSSYKDYKSYSYIEFHCSRNGFVDVVEDMRLLEDIGN